MVQRIPTESALRPNFLMVGSGAVFHFFPGKEQRDRASPGVQWLRLHTPNAQGPGSIPGQWTKILHAVEQPKH